MAEVNRLFRPEQYERQPNDFYPTPPEATQCLLATVQLRDFVWEPCAGQGLMAKTIADAGHRVTASDVVTYEGNVFPIITGIDALQAVLPSGVQTVVTNPPYGNMPHKLVRHWLGLLQPVSGMLCLLLNARWSESKRGQVLTTRHPAYAGKVKKGSGGSPGPTRTVDPASTITTGWSGTGSGIRRNCRSTCRRGIPVSRTAARSARRAGRPAHRREDVLGALSGGAEPATGAGVATG